MQFAYPGSVGLVMVEKVGLTDNCLSLFHVSAHKRPLVICECAIWAYARLREGVSVNLPLHP